MNMENITAGRCARREVIESFNRAMSIHRDIVRIAKARAFVSGIIAGIALTIICNLIGG